MKRTWRIFLCLLFSCLLGNLKSEDIPNCKFEDTVDLTNAVKHPNGAYNYKGIIIPREQTGTYDYEILEKGTIVKVPQHVRGCACKIKGCVKFCCHHLKLKIDEKRECASESQEDLFYNPSIMVTFTNGTTKSVNVVQEYLVQEGLPCSHTFALSPEEEPMATWKLFENGTLLREYDNLLMSRLDYCFSPHMVNDTYYLNPLNCVIEVKPSGDHTRNNYAMLISIPLLVFTIFVYVFIPELYTLYHKCFICYLVSLTVGYSILALINLSEIVFSPGVCVFLGFLLYFALISAFVWLSVISFHFWNYFRGNMYILNRREQNQKFMKYSLYAWGLTAFLTLLAGIAQGSGLSDDLKPGINAESCWINTQRKGTAFFYFYGPSLIILLMNLAFFVLTLFRVLKMKREFDRTSNSLQNFLTQKSTFELFFQLFVIMGINWILEVVSLAFSDENENHWFFQITDLYNSSQGIIVFILFILKPKVLDLIYRRIFRCERGDRELPQSSLTHTVPEEVLLRNVDNKY